MGEVLRDGPSVEVPDTLKKLDRQRNRIIRQLNKEQTADLLTELGHVEFRSARLLYAAEILAYDTAYEEAVERGADPSELAPNLDETAVFQSAAVAAYTEAVEAGAGEEATFYLAVTLQDLDRSADAVDQYFELISGWPESVYRSQAETAVGEFYFGGDRSEAALSHYEVAAALGGKLGDFASYKAAWCHYNLGDIAAAVSRMSAIAEAGSSDLAQEAAKDLVRFQRDLDN